MFNQAETSPEPELIFTVSARGKNPQVPVFGFLRRKYGNLRLNEIESLFGFVERCTLYGGRVFRKPELSDRDVMQLNNAGIGLRIPLTNHYATLEEYKESFPLLRKFHREGNSIITTNDELAQWVRQDFPRYRLDASVIKNINSHRKLKAALKIYDSVVLPMPSNEDKEFLQSVQDKSRVILFANAGCAFTCPSRICYASFSEVNKFKGGEPRCSRDLKERDAFGMIDFDLAPLVEMGYRHFKLLRARPGGQTGF